MTQPIVFGSPFLLFSWFFYRSLANTDVYEIKVWIFFGDGRSQRIEVVRGLQRQVVGKFVTPGIKLFVNRLVRHRNQIIYSHIFRTPIYATVLKYRSKINFAQKCRDSLFSKTWHLFSFLAPWFSYAHLIKSALILLKSEVVTERVNLGQFNWKLEKDKRIVKIKNRNKQPELIIIRILFFYSRPRFWAYSIII